MSKFVSKTLTYLVHNVTELLTIVNILLACSAENFVKYCSNKAFMLLHYLVKYRPKYLKIASNALLAPAEVTQHIGSSDDVSGVAIHSHAASCISITHAYA